MARGYEGKRPMPKMMADEFKRKRDAMGDDLPMSKEGSPTVTDTETGETTYGSPRRRPRHKKKGGMIECRGGGIAITGKKFQGVF
jgi:hypothetical protein